MSIFISRVDAITLETLEILRNNFSGFLEYKLILFQYFYNKYFREFIDLKLEDIDSFILKNWQNSLRVLLKILGLKIEIFNQKNERVEISAEKFILGMKIVIYQFDQNNFCILYDDYSSNQIINEQSKTVNSYVSINNDICVFCKYLCNESKDANGHFMHLKCIYKKRANECPDCYKPINIKCSICDRNKQPALFCENRSCAYCQNCLVNLKNSEKFQGSALCNCLKQEKRKIELDNLKLKCLKCLIPRYLEDFVIIYCPDQHEFLCKLCWSVRLERLGGGSTTSYKSEILACPLNNNHLGNISLVIFKLLSIQCSSCRSRNCKYYGDLICKSKCEVCFKCQFKDSKKMQKGNETCILCKKPLEKKSKPWFELEMINDRDSIEEFNEHSK